MNVNDTWHHRFKSRSGQKIMSKVRLFKNFVENNFSVV